MAFENFPATNQSQLTSIPPAPKNWRNYLSGVLIIALLGTWGYIIWDKNKTKETIQQKDTVIANTSSQKDQLQKELEEATSLYDKIKTSSANMMHSKDSVISSKERDINAKKEKIRQLLAKGESDKEAMAQARSLINSLNTDIENYRNKIETLEGEKLVLTQEKATVTRQRDEVKNVLDSTQQALKQKEDLLDIGSTLHASNFSILGIKETGNGEKETTTAKRVDKLRISFDIDENRITQTGIKNIYVCITGPDGNPISSPAYGSGKFNARDGQEKTYTQKLDVNYTQGQRQTLSFDFKQNSGFQTGDYKIEVYNNGFKIGEGVRSLKKGGLFS